MSLFSMSWLEALAATFGILTYALACCLAVDFFKSRQGRGDVGDVIEAERAGAGEPVQRRPSPVALSSPSAASPV
jgi:hypothetical protein